MRKKIGSAHSEKTVLLPAERQFVRHLNNFSYYYILYTGNRSRKQANADGKSTARYCMTTVFREFIIDGYNLLHKLFPGKQQRTLRERREEAESLLLGFQQSARVKVTVVYDGQQSRGSFREDGALNRVFTSQGHSADEWIIDYLKSLGSRSRMFTIVSSDRFICRHATAYGALHMLSEHFIERLFSMNEEDSKRGESGKTRKKFGSDRLSQNEVNHWLALFGEAKD